jgi:SAM-dependent methyltransferase
MTKSAPLDPNDYWQEAGKVGFGQAMYASTDVERHVRGRVWQAAIEMADAIHIPRDGHVLDYGCGDGGFANNMLARHYRAVDGYDKAEIAIARAKAEAAGPHMKFTAADLTTLDHTVLPHFDGAFLIGILHHIKPDTPKVVHSLAKVTEKMVVLQPNGNNLMRKALEFTPSYRSAGENSFNTREILDIFSNAGWRAVHIRRFNLFPNFFPGWLFQLLQPIESRVEASNFLNRLCTVNLFGLVLA